MNKLLVATLVVLSGVTNVSVVSLDIATFLASFPLITRELTMSTNSFVQTPRRAFAQPCPNSGSF
ncbi:hypothetical protein PF010_g22400 [Phytophthora fragariae]|uniref:Uncharacterized protein n=1 Tax=Phytophthora fragariae TaxID=53985 RepID=A0A6A3LKA5_9STRA|nr:hypothetical protein PF011_g6057 [Phytophthora fragariae]KAE9080395.1 hypothetical protein PF010_g22400 [Phytophthora fragariae]KAE9190873.1 hypothetical protein PF004_g21777 [Phytophthora fragariae]